MHEWGTRMLLKECLDRGMTKTELSRRFGVSRRTIHEWIETGQLDRDLELGADAVFSAVASDAQAGSLQGDHPGAVGGVSAIVSATTLRRGAEPK